MALVVVFAGTLTFALVKEVLLGSPLSVGELVTV